MTLKERALYHQIHPLKLATDILTAVISLYFLWDQLFVAGLVVHFVPPVIASALLIRYANLDKQAQSPFGRYVARHMTRTVEAVRLLGDLATVIGAWLHDPILIVLGFVVIVAAWCNGLLPSGRRAASR